MSVIQALLMAGGSARGNLQTASTDATIDTDGFGAIAGTASNSDWASVYCRAASPAAGSGLNYMEWVTATVGQCAYLFGLHLQSAFPYDKNPNGTGDVWGVQNDHGFQGPQIFAGGATGTGITQFGSAAGDVIGMKVDWSVPSADFYKNNVLLATVSLPTTAMDPFFTCNDVFYPRSAFRINVSPASWVYAQAGYSAFPQALA